MRFCPLWAISHRRLVSYNTSHIFFTKSSQFTHRNTDCPSNLDCASAKAAVNWEPLPGNVKTGFPKPTSCSVAVPAMAMPATAWWATSLNPPLVSRTTAFDFLKPSTAVPLFAGQVILAMSVSSLVDVPASYAHADIGSLDQSIHVGKKTGRNQMLISSWSVPTSNPNAKDQCCVVIRICYIYLPAISLGI